MAEPNLRDLVQREFLNCAVDPVHFFKKYAKIQHPIKGKINFELYPFQEDTLRQFRDYRFNIIGKSRQMGISTLCAGHSLHSMLFQDDFKILVIATTQEIAKNLVQKVQLMFDLLPAFLKQGITIVNNNKLSLTFSNGSSIKAVSSSPDAARSESLSLLLIDECAFVKDFDAIWTSAQLTLATGGKAILLSTPNGQSGLFYKLWQQAEEGVVVEGLDKFNPIKLPWYLHPERNKQWRDQQDLLLGKRQAGQECIDGECMVTVRNIQSEIIEKLKIEDVFNQKDNNIFEILTPTGFKRFDTIKKRSKSEYFEILFSNGKTIKSSIDHPFILDGRIILAYELFPGVEIDSDTGKLYVIDIKLYNNNIDLYDFINVIDGNVFIANNIVNHNCDVDFLTSGHTVIDAEILTEYEKELIRDPIEKRGIGGDVWIWKHVNYSKTYIVAADIARGDGEDYSAFHVIEAESVEQVAEFKGKVDPATFGNMLIAIATEYNQALLVIDNRNIGYATIQVAIDQGYKNLHYTYRNDPFLDQSIHLRKGYDLKDKQDMVPGYSIDVRTRPILISKLELYFRDKVPKIYSKRFINELWVFMWVDGKPQAQRGYNDDLVMAFCMALMVRDTSLKLKQIGIDITRNTLTHTHKTVFKPQPISSNKWEMNIGQSGQKENLKWLL